VVSGAAGSGGGNAFSSVLLNAFSSFNTTITQSTMASHGHGITTSFNPTVMTSSGTGESFAGGSQGTHQGLGGALSINSAGGDGAHAHVVQLNVQYVDLILASKDCRSERSPVLLRVHFCDWRGSCAAPRNGVATHLSRLQLRTVYPKKQSQKASSQQPLIDIVTPTIWKNRRSPTERNFFMKIFCALHEICDTQDSSR
jgi:hypothetical protein